MKHNFLLHLRRLLALTLLLTLYLFARLPDLEQAERASLSSQFRFTQSVMPHLSGAEARTIRPVNPSLAHIRSWISTVGAAAALNDLDGDGLPNDACFVDVRTDQVVVAPVPGSGQRYTPFALDPGPAMFSRSTMAPMGCLPGDVNEDGQMDLTIYYWGRTPVAFLRVAPGEYKPVELASGQRWYSNAAAFADVDGDGHADLIVGNYFADGAHILDATSPIPDHMQASMSRADNGGRSRILLWSGVSGGAVTFRDAGDGLPPAYSSGWTLAVGAQDLDGDLLPEIYFANDFGPDVLFHNRSTPGKVRLQRVVGTKELTTPNSKVLGRDSFKGMGIDFGDLNGDGRPDFVVSNIAAPYSLEESHFAFVSTGAARQFSEGIAPYADRSEPLGLSRSGWGWDMRIADMNNDGIPEVLQATGFLKGTANRWPELHETAMGNDQLLQRPGIWHNFQPGDDLSGHQHNPFFVRSQSGRYFDLAPELGIADPHVSRGIAIADVDGDGLLDYVLANQWEPSIFVHNSSPAGNAFLGLRLLNKGVPAIGATASVRLANGHRLIAQVDGGNGHSGKRSFDLHFGLGKVKPHEQVNVDVKWRDASGVHHKALNLTQGWHKEELSDGQ